MKFYYYESFEIDVGFRFRAPEFAAFKRFGTMLAGKIISFPRIFGAVGHRKGRLRCNFSNTITFGGIKSS